jgi:hypothetical protein
MLLPNSLAVTVGKVSQLSAAHDCARLFFPV